MDFRSVAHVGLWKDGDLKSAVSLRRHEPFNFMEILLFGAQGERQWPQDEGIPPISTHISGLSC